MEYSFSFRYHFRKYLIATVEYCYFLVILLSRNIFCLDVKIALKYYNNNDRLTAFDPGQPG